MPDNGRTDYPPPRIIVCAIEGDWVEWEKDDPPAEGDCPFGECDCTPVLYVRGSQGEHVQVG